MYVYMCLFFYQNISQFVYTLGLKEKKSTIPFKSSEEIIFFPAKTH